LTPTVNLEADIELLKLKIKETKIILDQKEKYEEMLVE